MNGTVSGTDRTPSAGDRVQTVPGSRVHLPKPKDIFKIDVLYSKPLALLPEMHIELMQGFVPQTGGNYRDFGRSPHFGGLPAESGVISSLPPRYEGRDAPEHKKERIFPDLVFTGKRIPPGGQIFPVHWSSQPRTVSCHRILFCGFSTRWFSSGKYRSLLGIFFR